MTWRTVFVESCDLLAALARIRGVGGTVTRCCPDHGAVRITYVEATAPRGPR